MSAHGAKHLFALVWFVLGLNALTGADEFENPLFTVQTRSHHQVRTRASRSTRVNLDHAIEHIDDEHASEASESANFVAVVTAAPEVELPSFAGEAIYTPVPQALGFAPLPIRAGRAPPTSRV